MINQQHQQQTVASLFNHVVASNSHDRIKALRELKNVLARQGSIDGFPDIAPIQLAKSILSFPATAKLASQVLLQILSNSSPTILRQQAQSIIQPILAAFSASTQHLPSTPSNRDQLIKLIYIIRILTTLIAKTGSSALINLSDQIHALQKCYHPIPTHSQVLHPRERITLGLQPPPRRLTHQPVPTRSISTVTQSSDSETNSEGEGITSSSSNTHVQAIQCRLDALNCLRTIAQSDPKALYPFWPQLLPAHEYRIYEPYTLLTVVERDSQLMVRLRACHIIKIMLQDAGPYMAIAEESTSRVSYISLSAKIASITGELHRRIGTLLKSPPISSELTKEILHLCETLASVSAYHRISTPIVHFILNPMLGLLTLSDFEISMQSKKTLAAILEHLTSVAKCPTLDVRDIVDQITLVACHGLLSEPTGPSALLWCDLLRTTLPFLVWNEDLRTRILQLQSVFKQVPEHEEEDMKAKLALVASLAIFFPGADFDDTYVRWVKARLRDGGLDSLDRVMSSNSQRLLPHLFSHISSDLLLVADDVRAVRLLGIIMSKRCTSDPLELATQVTLYLVKYFESMSNDDPDGKSVSTHTWALANCLDVIDNLADGRALSPPFDANFWTAVLDTIQRLVSNGDPSNTLQTNSVRIIGVAVSRLVWAAPAFPGLEDKIVQAVQTLMEHLAAALPKVQWNAANAARQILRALTHTHTSSSSLAAGAQFAALRGLISGHLARTLEHSGSFKVRIQVCLALQAAPDQLSAETLDSVAMAKHTLDDQVSTNLVPDKETGHAQRLLLEMGKLLSWRVVEW
ncbi:hypothetical protein PCASD_08901 [Puccinia coronata f. sp. avenae]|uniref:DUF4042 domain-containing protein n=1 Tax=Puccinia coronata f. sp. avenae TaxID=200324 RepID=A0A2N5UUA5_9BASI|nr:hypothetical protein PCASD_08901 [Puccinia coronata f. sp. avenae]